MKDKFIGLMVEDRPALVVGFLAILKSGNALVPVNPEFPDERVHFILNDLNIGTLVTDDVHYPRAQQIARVSSVIRHLLCIDCVTGELIASQSFEGRSPVLEIAAGETVPGMSAPTCYVIYTSGSTGRPKGVPITHQNLVPLLLWFGGYFQLGGQTKIFQNLSYTFDFGVFEILTTVIFGGTIYMLSKKDVGDFVFYADFIEAHGINTIHTTPTFFAGIVSTAKKMPSLDIVHLGGENLTGVLTARIKELTSETCRIYNGYGPTEATINCSIYRVPASQSRDLAERESIPIGKPSAWNRIYILDRFQRLQSVGAAGELCVAGLGLSQGYLNQPELTAEKFRPQITLITQINEIKNKKINKSFAGVKGGLFQKPPLVVYKTGDLARWLSNGNIEFLGRIDQQVKIRGYRIELGEIENSLLTNNAIKEAVVMARQDEDRGRGQQYLCAYIIPQEGPAGENVTVSELREYLLRELPDYMIPAYFITLEKIPLTSNGKLDRRALPPPTQDRIMPRAEYTPPANETEQKMAVIWQEILGIERIGREDNFFESGGDSILATQCIARLREEFKVDLSLRKMFECPSIKTLSKEIAAAAPRRQEVLSITKAPRDGHIPLSFSQERLWFLQELDAGNVAYFVPRVIRMKGKLDAILIERTFSEIIRRHEILRTVFPLIDGQPVQQIQSPDSYPFTISVSDWSGLEKEEQEQKVSLFLNEEGRRPFDFEHGPLLRVNLLKLQEEEHLFVLTEHHLVHDGWTQGVLLQEFIAIFSANSEGKDHYLKELPIQYADYAIWQRNYLEGDVLERQLTYWKEKLSGLPPVLNLPTDYPRPPVISGQGALEDFHIPGSITKFLKEFSRENGVTLFMVMLAVFKTLLYRYTEVEDLCVGTGIANRRYKEMEGMLGMVINTLPLRTQVKKGISFKQFLNRVKETCLEAYQHEDTPFGKIVEIMRPERSLSVSPIFQVMFTFMDTPGEGLRLPGLELELLPSHNRSSKFDINVVVVPPQAQQTEEPSEILVEWEYNTDIFAPPTIAQMISHYKRLLEVFLGQPETNISTLSLLSDLEIKQVLYEFNDTEKAYPREKTVHQLFAEQVARTADCIALSGESVRHVGLVSLSYSELNEQSDRLAGLLIEKGIRADDVVGIMMERSIDLVIGIFGIIKSGGAYLPIDPGHPQERIDCMLKDSGAAILLTDYEKKKPANCQLSIVNCQLLMNWPQTPFHHSSFIIHHSSHLAYIIYTSGSTGRPKGVAVEHRQLVNFIYHMFNRYDGNVGCDDRCLSHTNIMFDVSVWEFFLPLTFGARLVLLAEQKRFDMFALTTVIERETITLIYLPPALLAVFCEQLKTLRSRVSLNKMLVGVEPIRDSVLEEYMKLNPGMKIINGYGPTETTICASSYDYYSHPPGGEIVPIGTPLSNNQILLLDTADHIVPRGIPGEICISGDGVSRGYLNNPELTAEKYTPHPFYHEKRMYRSGDRARWLPDPASQEAGVYIIEFLGRIDHQVKIRGYRIELGEIESRLSKLPGIKESVVLVREKKGADKYLCAYIVSNKEIYIPEIREYLSAHLPDYMIPSFFVTIDSIPLTPTGKIDRRALPEPEAGDMTVQYTAPRNIVEKKLVEIWEKVLGRNNIGVNDNFFLVGGDSIKSIQIISRMSSAGYQMEMKDIFQYPIISKLAQRVKKLERIPDQSVITGTIPLTPIQKAFFNESHGDRHHYNQTVMLYSKTELDQETIKKVFAKIQEHHDTLRVIYKKDEDRGEVIQVGRGLEYPLYLEEHDLKNRENCFEELKTKANGIQASIDLEKGPLMKLGLFHLDDGDRLLIVIHHLVIDGVSWRILFEDIETLYRRYKRGKKLALPAKTDSFKRWSEKLSVYADSKIFLKEITYWQKIESVEAPPIAKDFNVEDNYIKDTESVSFTIGEEQTELLLTNVNKAFRTETNDILLTALGMGIKKTFALDRGVAIALEGHGREAVLEDIDIGRTTGWFTCVYPAILDVTHADAPGRQIKEIKETLRRIPNKGIGYGILKHLTGEENKKGIEFKLKPQISFNYLGQFDADIKQITSFEIAKESAGNSLGPNNKREYLLDVSGMIANNRLTMTISYNKLHFKPETLAGLVDNFESELTSIIEFCCARDNIEPTPVDFTYKDLSIESIDRLTTVYPDLEDLYTLTPMQEGMLYHALVYDSSDFYFEQMSYRLQGELDINLVEKSVNELLKRHDILRTTFVYKDLERPVQVVLKDRTIDFYYEDIRKRERKEILFKEIKEKDKRRSFDLSKDVLIRLSILQVEDSEYEFTWSYHHIIMDGWCIGILNSEFLQIYTAYLKNKPYRLPVVQPYKAYIQWLEKLDKEESSRYWENYLDSYETQTGIPKTKISKERNSYKNETVSIILDMEKTAVLNKLAAGNYVAINTVVQALWGILLGKYADKEDVVFGAVVSGRPFELEGVETMVGLFINTIPVRIRFNERMTLNMLFRSIQEDAVAGKAYHYHPLADIQSLSPLKQNLIDHILAFENYPIAEQIENYGKFKLTGLETFMQTNYDLNVVLAGPERLTIAFKYNGNVYDQDYIERIAGRLLLVFDQVIDNRELEVGELTFLSEEEKNQLLYEFNDTAAEYPKDKVIHQLFEEQVERATDRIAVFGHGRTLTWTDADNNIFMAITYSQLNEQSNHLAGLLIEKGVLADDIVGIMLERSIDLIIGIIGILKAGGAYLPIDPEYPKERIDYMLKDSGAKIMIGSAEEQKSGRAEFVFSYFFPASPLPRFLASDSSNLAYVMYTSGSTGRPKGVMVTHRNVVRLVKNTNFVPLTGETRILQTGAPVFDATTFEIWGSLLNGGQLVLAAKEVILDAYRLGDILKGHFINTLWLSAPLFSQLMQQNIGLFAPLSYLLVGGDVLSPLHINRVRARFPHLKIINGYGPTENTTFSTTYSIEKEFEQGIPIGRPIANSTVYIYDKGRQLVPVGVWGELVVGGDGVALGYLNNPELTAEKFDQDLWDEQDNQDEKKKSFAGVIYKTGDLARWLPNGTIEFKGRIDHQVKIRGFRIELGEIENRLAGHPLVKEAVVIDLESDGDKYLCAYIISAREYDIAELRESLAKELPGYMIPSYFVRLEKFPLTANGKIDRRSLPKPELKVGESYTAPRNEIETKLVKLWAEILGRDPLHASQLQTSIGIHDNFFELGGHSLKATTMMSKIHKELEVKVELMDIFRTPFIRDIARLVQGLKKEAFQAIEPVEKKEYYPLSSAQKRLYFIQQLDLNSTGYNIPMVLPLGQGIKKDKLEPTLKRLIARHESLRTSIKRVKDDVVQRIHPAESIEFSLDYYEAGETGIEEIIQSYVRPFDLSRAPLIRSGLITFPDGHCTWIVDIHHIVSDGTSQTILAEDFIRLYETDAPLEPLPVQYRDFARWQNQLFTGGWIKNQEDYWLRLYAGEIPRLNLPADYKRPAIFTFAGDRCVFKLEKENAIQFKALGARYGGTLYMNMMAALNTLFYKYTGQTDIIIGSGIAGRRHADTQGVVGMFVNTLALRNFPAGEKSYEHFLREVISNSVTGFENQDVQFEELVEKLEPERDPSRNPLFDIIMVAQNFRQVNVDIQWKIANENLPGNRYKNTTSKFDLTVFISESEDDVFINLEYYTAIFKEETITRLAAHFKNVIQTVIKNPAIALKDIDILSEKEKEQLLYEFNDTSVEFPGDKTVHRLIDEQVARTPGHVALIYKDQVMTYQELDRQTNRLARYLFEEKKVGIGEPIGVWMSQPVYRQVAILAILKAGGAFVPMDPATPPERIGYIINDARMGVVISEKHHLRDLNRLQWECANFHSYLCIDSFDIHVEEEQEINQLMDQELWQHVGESAVDEITGGGWLSSYTGLPISREEMDEYGDNILKKLELLLHKGMKVLEIGCASGISMYRIAPKMSLYYGTDLSEVIIEKNKKQVQEKGFHNIELACLPAHEIDQVPIKDFDLVIINSVIQCFHGHNYLRKVLQKAVALLGDKGYLFIGDVMNRDKKDALVRDLTAFKEANRYMGYTTKTDFSAELFVAPGFWQDLEAEWGEIETVTCSDKIYSIENELTKFRYDVLLKVNKAGKNHGVYRKKFKYQDDMRVVSRHGDSWADPGILAGNLAYIIYTSGSTGKPKGVMVEHRSLVNLCQWHNMYYAVTLWDRATKYAGFGFDASVWEFFPYLLTGAAVCIAPEEIILDIEALNYYYEKNGVTVGFLPTQVCEQFMALNNRSLRILLTGGDKLRNYIKGNYRLYNNYGPTENTVVTTSYWVMEESGNIPIGKPIANNQVYILDRNNYLQPVGVPGELCIGGDGVARGYLNNSELTAEKFNRSYRSYKTYINYKTGDLARWLNDGNIEFLGRIDLQVKIRGFRIELGEIETRLLKHHSVKEAVVIDRTGNGETYLCAYIVSLPGGLVDLDTLELGSYLSRFLPGYMVPNHLIKVDHIPLTVSGKVDRNALPAPRFTGPGDYTAPANDVEVKLALIWSEVLTMDSGKISMDSNFFQLGGHSLKATVLVSKIHKELNVKIPLAEIFTRPILRELAHYIENASMGGYSSIEKVEEKEYYALSPAQKRIYILCQMAPGSTAYNISGVLELHGIVDKELFEVNFRKLIDRHESFRTGFHLIDGEPVQRIHKDIEFKIDVLGGGGQGAGVREEKNLTKVFGSPETFFQKGFWSPEAIIKSFIRPFDLSRAPLLRVGLVKTGEEKYILVVDMSHIISDGISLGLLIKDFAALFARVKLSGLKLRYKDYSVWQNRLLELGEWGGQEGYWNQQFEEEIPELSLPADFQRPLIQVFEGRAVGFEIGAGDTTALKRIASERGMTLYMMILSLYYVFLSKVGGQEDIVVGTPVAGRTHAELECIIGMFVNTLALRNYPSAGKTFDEFFPEIKQRTLEAFGNQDYPFDTLVERLEVTRDLSRNPLFDVMFEMQNMEIPEIRVPELIFAPYPIENKASQFDLTLSAVEQGDKIYFSFKYCSKLFKEETIRRFIGYFEKIISIALESSHKRIGEIEIISDEEKKHILDDFNDTLFPYPNDKTIHRVFEKQVERTPDHIALSFQTVQPGPPARPVNLTYRELNDRSDQVAHLLIEKGVLADNIVGIMIERSIEMIIGVFGILKSGGAYLPIALDYPQERIDYMLKDSGARILINKSEIRNPKFEKNPNDQKINDQNKKLHLGAAFVLSFENLNFNSLKGSPRWELSGFEFRASNFNPSNLAYIIYTSGSTGKPKGVAVEHHSVINRLNWMQRVYPMGEKDRILHKTPIVFDVSVWELFWWSFRGASLRILEPDGEKSPETIAWAIYRESVTTLHFVPSMLSAFLDYVQDNKDASKLKSIRNIFSSGEALGVHHVGQFNRLLYASNNTHLINLYGPTEATVDVSFFNCDICEDQTPESIPIGKPIDNIQLYVLDKGGGLQPVGITGELCISGVGLARGYLNRPELTAENFIKYRYYRSYRTYILYKTGDLARWLNDGNIEFLGRIDHQVKIRGFRIEPGEIENFLRGYNGIKEAIVVARVDKNGENHLCAYIVLSDNNGTPPDIDEIRDYLSRVLPGYMIPAYIVKIEEVPLTANGKLDRRALPEPVNTGDAIYTAPRTSVEEELAAIWDEILGGDALYTSPSPTSIGIDDNFFHLGGHSINAAAMTARIHKKFQVKVTLAEIFQRPTIRQLAQYIEGKTKEYFYSIIPAEPKSYYEVSSAQKRLYITHQMNPWGIQCNMPHAFILEGELDMAGLGQTFTRLIQRHESLRTGFEMRDNLPVQVILPYVEIKIENCIDNASPLQIIRNFVRPFELSTPPLLRIGVAKIAGNKHLMIVDMHHIVSDGISIGIMEEDFTALYAGEELLPLKLQYKDFSEWQNRLLAGDEIQKQRDYWLKEFSEEAPTLDLPVDYPRSPTSGATGDTVYFRIERELTQEIKKLNVETETTSYMVLLAALYILLHRYSGRRDIVVGTITAGRRHPDLDHIIGVFVNMLPVRNKIQENMSFGEFLEQVKAKALNAFENQDFQYDELVNLLGIKARYEKSPLFDVHFTFQNALEYTGKKKTGQNTGFVLNPYPYREVMLQWELGLAAIETGDTISFSLDYLTALFKKVTVENIGKHFVEILEQCIRNTEIKIKDIVISLDLAQGKIDISNEEVSNFEF